MIKSLVVPYFNNLVHANLKISLKTSGNLPGKYREKRTKYYKALTLSAVAEVRNIFFAWDTSTKCERSQRCFYAVVLAMLEC